jgi:hypothetical protein
VIQRVPFANMLRCLTCPYVGFSDQWHRLRDRAEYRYRDIHLRNSCTQSAEGDRERFLQGAGCHLVPDHCYQKSHQRIHHQACLVIAVNQCDRR